MAISMARVRVWLVVGAALLVLTIAGFLGYARFRANRFLAGLPGKLGVDIRRETNGYTVSKSVGPNTTMTLHAARAVEHKDGKLTLHDVSVVLYGRKQDRQDRISGAEFEYDQQTGVVRATGEVHIDLQAPTHGETGMPALTADGEDKGIVHIKTSGLIFLQKLGVAATDQELEFRFGAMTGRARGAEYNSDSGMMILQSEVEAHGEQHGAPVMLKASHAELDRPRLLATAIDARYSSPTQTAQGDHALVHLRSDSTPERIEADGHVALAGVAGGTVTTPHADVLLTESGKPRSAHLFGGVKYAELASLREGRTQSDDARVTFDAIGKAQTVLMTGEVYVAERTRQDIKAPWSERSAVAGRMNFALDGGNLRTVEANDAAKVVLQEVRGVSELSGDSMRGQFTGVGKAIQLNPLRATGHTRLHRLLADGAEQTSAGDTLDVRMRPGGTGMGDVAQAVDRATQTGHVVLTSRAALKPGKTGPASTSRATASMAVYEGEADHVTLSGGAEILDETGRMAANSMVLEHGSGDATAEGAVKATYLQSGGAEPVHVVADRAELHHDAGRAIFRGGLHPARMWQAGSQVEAPVLELEQEARTLTAHGDAKTSGIPVHVVLAGTNTDEKSTVVRVVCRTMVYRDAERQVDFVGDVQVEDADGTARAAEATAFLQPADAAKQKAAKEDAAKTGGVSLGGSVERIVAKGKVEIVQPGRRATGEQFVYTAWDGLFVLTGTSAVRPRLIDETQGTVTGLSLSFHGGDKSVVVSGGAGERVQTVTRVKQR